MRDSLQAEEAAHCSSTHPTTPPEDPQRLAVISNVNFLPSQRPPCFPSTPCTNLGPSNSCLEVWVLKSQGSSLQHIPALDAKPPTHDFVDLWLLSPQCQLLEASPFLELIPLPLTPTSEPHRELDAWVRKDLISKAPSELRAGHVSYHISGCGQHRQG